nr:MAG TPA: hypothetical protein [Caudoviricetes sp.]
MPNGLFIGIDVLSVCNSAKSVPVPTGSPSSIFNLISP